MSWSALFCLKKNPDQKTNKLDFLFWWAIYHWRSHLCCLSVTEWQVSFIIGACGSCGKRDWNFFWKQSVSTDCQIIKKGAFQRKLCVMWLHLLSMTGWEKEETSKKGRERGKDWKREKWSFCQGRLKLQHNKCRNLFLVWFQYLHTK